MSDRQDRRTLLGIVDARQTALRTSGDTHTFTRGEAPENSQEDGSRRTKRRGGILRADRDPLPGRTGISRLDNEVSLDRHCDRYARCPCDRR